MPLVTSDLLRSIYTNFRTQFDRELGAAYAADNVRNLLALEVPSRTLIENYSWVGTVPKMREWIGERQLSGLSGVNYEIRNKDWESTIEVDRNAIEDDTLGQYMPRIRSMPREAVRSQEQLVLDMLEDGNTGLAYDGQFFFDTDHVTPGATYQTSQSNKLTGTGTTLAQIAADYEAARIAMRNFKDDQGRPMNLQATHVLAPPALEGKFKQLLASDGISADNSANPWRGTAQLLVSGYLDDANDWYLLALNETVKPMIFQMRRAVEFAAQDNPNNNEAAFMRKRYMYGVDGRWNAGYGMWQLAVRTVNT